MAALRTISPEKCDAGIYRTGVGRLKIITADEGLRIKGLWLFDQFIELTFTMNPAQLKCLGVFSLFAIIGFDPISPGCLIAMYIVTMRPDWFLALTEYVSE